MHFLRMQEATLWLIPLLLAAAVAVLAISTQRRHRGLRAEGTTDDSVQQRRAALCGSAVTWLYASMAIFIAAVGIALSIRSAQYSYTSALSLCTGLGVLALLVANAQLLREALLDASRPTDEP